MARDIPNMIAEADNQLWHEVERKDQHGAEAYGEFAFLKNPTLEMAMDELVDLINYAKYTYRKLFIMNEMLQAMDKARTITNEGFISTSDLTGHQE